MQVLRAALNPALAVPVPVLPVRVPEQALADPVRVHRVRPERPVPVDPVLVHRARVLPVPLPA